MENVARAVGQRPGVEQVAGDAEAKTITVVYRPGAVELARIQGAIAERGFEVTGVLGRHA